MHLFDKIGFSWDRTIVPLGVATSVERSVFRYKQMLAQIVFDFSVLEGNPFTYSEVKTLLDSVTVGGRKVSDHEQVLNLAAAAKELFSLVKSRRFRLDKAVFNRLHGIVAREEALEWGHFRGEGEIVDMTPRVAIGSGEFTPAHSTEPGAKNLKQRFDQGVSALCTDVSDPRERAMAFFLFGALHRFYFDGNKRTSRFMMNGVLMSHGMDAISVPAVRAREFNQKMVHFYVSKNATEMMGFLIDCEPKDAPKSNPEPSFEPSI